MMWRNVPGFQGLAEAAPGTPATSPYGMYLVNSGLAAARANASAQNEAPSGRFTVPVTGDAEQNLTNLTNAQWEFFRQKVRPVETRVLNRLTDENFAGNVGRRGLRAATDAFDGTQGMEERMLSRYGVTPTRGQQRFIDRQDDLARGLALAGGFNTAKNQARDFQIQGLADAMQIGRGVAGQSLSSATDQANIQTQRNEAADSIRAQGRQATIGNVLGIAGLAAAFI